MVIVGLFYGDRRALLSDILIVGFFLCYSLNNNSISRLWLPHPVVMICKDRSTPTTESLFFCYVRARARARARARVNFFFWKEMRFFEKIG